MSGFITYSGRDMFAFVCFGKHEGLIFSSHLKYLKCHIADCNSELCAARVEKQVLSSHFFSPALLPAETIGPHKARCRLLHFDPGREWQWFLCAIHFGCLNMNRLDHEYAVGFRNLECLFFDKIFALCVHVFDFNTRNANHIFARFTSLVQPFQLQHAYASMLAKTRKLQPVSTTVIWFDSGATKFLEQTNRTTIMEQHF